MAGQLKEKLGISELTAKDNIMWKALLAEFLGTFMLNFFGCASVIQINPKEHEHLDLMLVAFSFGLAVFVIVQTIGHVSGGHINPAVTAGMLVAGKIPIIRGIFYIIVQCIGALAGSAFLKALTPDAVQHSLGNTALGGEVSPVQGFGMEFMLGFLLVVVVFGVCDENRHETKSVAPLAIGLAVALGHLAAIDYTGSSMNPARSFGSAVLAGEWDNHWVYWVGPILGGIAAALIYTHAFTAPTPSVRIIERYTAVQTEEKELKRLDGNGSKTDVALA